VHGGLLAVRDDKDHRQQVTENAIEYIDMIVVNLYPFSQTVARPDVTFKEAIENIDIGGPSMIRSAAKNFNDVVVLVNTEDYSLVADEMDTSNGSVSKATRFRLARRAFEITARYDASIAEFLAGSVRFDAEGDLRVEKAVALPKLLTIIAEKEIDLRYGENPHQRAALYVPAWPRGLAQAEKIQGKELSFNNLIDLESAWALVSDFDAPGCAIIKHTNPCGAATATNLREAFERARSTDPVSAFGGIVGFNRPVTEEAARAVSETFFEAIVAPDFDRAALDVLAQKKNLRVLRVGDAVAKAPFDIRAIGGGLLVQDRDQGSLKEAELKVVSERAPTTGEMEALQFAWIVAKHVKSNAIVYARAGQLIGVGAGQMSRVDSVKIGAAKAQLPLAGAVLASDAFFPFRDGIDEAARTGITAVIQPGGSVRDQEVIAAANEHKLAMVLTGMRHFKH
jgi:phosphoribosylaminoimidazolecarboxamide formyltransferase/IMP cyclohydrolase